MAKKAPKSYWNFRIFKDQTGDLCVAETYYTNDKINGVGRVVIAGCESVEELLEAWEVVKADIIKSKDNILDWSEHVDKDFK